MIEPATNAMTPPTPSTPTVGVTTSATISAIPTRISAKPCVVDRQHLERVGAEQQADDAH